MIDNKPAPLVIHGWAVFTHPLFMAQIDALTKQVEVFKKNDPVGYAKKNASKRLAAITKLALDVFPRDPTRVVAHSQHQAAVRCYRSLKAPDTPTRST